MKAKAKVINCENGINCENKFVLLLDVLIAIYEENIYVKIVAY